MSSYSQQYVDVTHARGARCAQVLTCVYAQTHLRHADTEARGRRTAAAISFSALSTCSHVRPLSQAHPHRALFVHFASLEKCDEEPWEKASGLLKLLGVGLLF